MVIPIRDDVPLRAAPLAVVALLVLNAGVFARQLVLVVFDPNGPEALADWIDRYALVPREFLRGLADPAATRHRVWLTPVTSMFLHGGILHLAGNALYLWIFGRTVEGVLGPARFLVFYLTCGLFAAAVHVASDPTSYAPTLGASGAISGVLGAYWVTYPGARIRLLWPRVRIPALLLLGVWIGLQVLAGLRAPAERAGGIAWWAHVGGFVAGVTLARAMWVRKPTRARRRR